MQLQLQRLRIHRQVSVKLDAERRASYPIPNKDAVLDLKSISRVKVPQRQPVIAVWSDVPGPFNMIKYGAIQYRELAPVLHATWCLYSWDHSHSKLNLG